MARVLLSLICVACASSYVLRAPAKLASPRAACRVSSDAMARLGPKLAKALVAKHASRSSDFSFTDKVRSKVRKYVDEYVERKGAELRK